MNGFDERLAERLQRPLPGTAAQSRFAPELSFGRHFAPPPADARRAAVIAAERGLKPSATLAVGDGANDLDMLRAAGLGVAFRAKPIVAAAAQARVDHADLRALLFAQGYRAEEIVARWP